MRQRNRPIQTNFTSGQLSGRMRGRVDLEQYGDAAATVSNFQVLQQGGLTRRLGGKYVSSVAVQAQRPRLKDIIVSDLTAYVLEFGQGYVRINMNRGPVLNPDGSVLQLATPYQSGDLRTLRFTTSADVTYITHVNYPPMILTRLSPASFTLAPVVFLNGPYDTQNTGNPTNDPGNTDTSTTLTSNNIQSGGAGTVTASAPLFQANDVGRAISLFLLAPDRLAGTAYGIGQIFISTYNTVQRVYQVISGGVTAAVLPSGTTPDYDENAPYLTGLNVADGTCILSYLGAGTNAYGYGTITAVNSSTNVSVTISSNAPFASQIPTLVWRLGDWSPARGYPSCCTIYQQRTVWGGNLVKPSTLWFSSSGDFQNMTDMQPDGTVLDTNAITITIDDDQVNVIGWMAGIPRGLAIGCSSGEFLVGPASTVNAALTPSNIRSVRQTDRGSANIAGIRISGVILFVQRGALKVRELQYDFATDSFYSTDLTQLSDDITGSGVVEMAYQELREGTLWLVRRDGVLISLTYDREQKIRAWTSHTMGGANAVVESIACVPNPSNTGDDLYIAVARTVGGTTLRTVEYLDQPFRSDLDGPNGGYFVDCGLTYIGAPALTFSGLTWLNGQTVAICADGAVRPNQVVVNGAVTIDPPAAGTVHVGLPFTSLVTMLPAELRGGIGSTQAALQELTDVFLRLLETRGGQAGDLNGTLYALEFRQQQAQMSQAYPLFTGDYRTTFPDDVERDAQLTVLQDQPLPMTLLAVVEDITTNA